MFENVYLKLGIAAAILAAITGDVLYIKHLQGQVRDRDTTITKLQDKIDFMTLAQKDQTKTSEDNVTKVITIPATKVEIIKAVDKAVEDAPACVAPDYPEAVRNSF